MAAVALPHDPRSHLARRAFVAAFLGLALLGGTLLAGIITTFEPTGGTVGLRTTDEASAPVAAHPTSRPPTDAIDEWLVDTGALPGEYTGTCADAGVVDRYCSSLVEDRGDTQIHTVGLYASDMGADVLLSSDTGTWTVIGAERWPELGARYDGPAWSPITAITSWWHEGDRAVTQYGPGAVHLRDCTEAARDAVDQPLLCSTLVDDAGSTRVYDTGRAGAPADVRVTLVEQADHTWRVVESAVR